MSDKIFLIFEQNCEMEPGDSLIIIGERKELGNWDLKDNILHTNKEIYPLWKSNPISFPYQEKLSFEYKYCIKKKWRIKMGRFQWK